MASYQKMYYHDAVTTVGGTLPGATDLETNVPEFTASGASTNRTMNNTVGSSQVTATTGAQSFGTGSTQCWFRRFISEPLNAQSIGAGTWTMSGAGRETSANANQFMGVGGCWLWRPSTGAIITTIFTISGSSTSTEPGTTQTAVVGTCTGGAAATALAGDVLVYELWSSGAPSMSGTYTIDVFYDGTTEASTTSCAAFLQAPAAISFQDPVVPSGPPRQKRRRAWQHLMRMAGGEGCERRRSGILVPRLWRPADARATVR
jgi:hypothetical protein